jgi:hypothetical protein
LPSIAITVTRTATPRPSDMTTLGVTGARPVDIGKREPHHGRGRARQPACAQHQQCGHQPQQHEHRQRGGDEDRGDAPVIGERDGDACERAADQRRCDDVGPARPVPLAGDLVAEQRRDRHVMGAAERP